MHPHPGGLRDQLNLDQTNPTLIPGGPDIGDSPTHPPPPSWSIDCTGAGTKVVELETDEQKRRPTMSAGRLLP
ncbi:hypothetical protein BVC93_23610 [Mycobacterium sp. MS1601]|nr:hypothetical protein BVC93_23610 [Mycobacterium sp. MS1601]